VASSSTAAKEDKEAKVVQDGGDPLGFVKVSLERKLCLKCLFKDI
jgi:hypothetical protein